MLTLIDLLELCPIVPPPKPYRSTEKLPRSDRALHQHHCAVRMLIPGCADFPPSPAIFRERDASSVAVNGCDAIVEAFHRWLVSKQGYFVDATKFFIFIRLL